MGFRDRCGRVGQTAAVRSDQEIHPIDTDEPCSQLLDIGAAAMIIIRGQLERNRRTTLRDEKAPSRVGLLNPQTEPVKRLLSLQRIHTGLRQSCANGKGGHERAIRKAVSEIR